MSQKTIRPNPLGKILSQFSASHSTAVNKLIHYITIPLVSFSVLALVWAIPFPFLSFLGRYNGFVNWASILIGIAVYYYYRVSPLLSYGILLLIFAFSAFIVALEKFHNQGDGPEMHIIPLLILLPALLAQVAGHRTEKTIPSVSSSLQSLMDGPLWLMNALFKKLGLIK